MPKSLNKVQKHITKKKGKINALHVNSRDSKSLLRAGGRDQKVAKLASMREKANRPYIQRIKFFQEQVASRSLESTEPIPPSLPEILALINDYISRTEAPLEEERSVRREGRPKSAREEFLAKQLESETKEFDLGFWLPDLTDKETLRMLHQWSGEWVGLNNLKFERVKKTGERKVSMFPPKGNS